MAVSEYTSPTCWNDLDMDWSSPDLRQFKYVDALILALEERDRLIVDRRYYRVCRYGYRKFSILKLIHEAVIDMIPDYVNHTKDLTGVKYQGMYSIYDWRDTFYWTIEELLEYIGYDAVIYPNQYSPDNNTWGKFIYKVINCLRWQGQIATMIPSYFNVVMNNIAQLRHGVAYIADDSDQAAVNAGVDEAIANMDYLDYDVSGYPQGFTKTYRYGRITCSAYSIANFTTHSLGWKPRNYAYDLYYLMYRSKVYDGGVFKGSNGIKEGANLGYSGGVVNPGNESPAAQDVQSPVYGSEFWEPPKYPGVPGENLYDTTWIGWAMSEWRNFISATVASYFILKYDVDGGYKFIE